MGISSSSEEKKQGNVPKQGIDAELGGGRAGMSISTGRRGAESPLLIGSPLDSPQMITGPRAIGTPHGHYRHASSGQTFPEQSPPYHPQPTDSPKEAIGKDSQAFPTVFSWRHGGRNIYVAGTFNNWKERIPLQESHGDFTVIQSLPPGTYYYRYIVDGQWQTDPGLPVVTDPQGEPSHMMEVRPPTTEAPLLSQSPPGEYSQNIPASSSSASTASSPPSASPIRTVPGSNAAQTLGQSPPALPPHLMRALLNTAPPSAKDPSLLPLPHHVMLNHLYSLPRTEAQVLILGVTQRYKAKFVTTVFYKPLLNGEDGSQEDGVAAFPGTPREDNNNNAAGSDVSSAV